MTEQTDNERTLTKNNIKRFILRIDLLPGNLLVFDSLIDKIASDFERIEKRIIEGVEININQNIPELNPIKDFEYVLVSDTMNIFMTFSKPQQAFWFETTSYIDNSTYKLIFEKIQKILITDVPQLTAKRIGMRFINEFPCKQESEIKKVLKSEKSKIIIDMLKDENLTRALSYKEYNCDSIKSRVQYGLANKFFPSLISTYDITLDIDVFTDLQINVKDWNEKITELNHKSYDFFVSNINEKYLGILK